MARKKDADVFQPGAEVRRIISLDSGRWAYVIDLEGRTHHLRTDSAEFAEMTSDERFDRDKARLGMA